jgi:hypothetical protein
MPDADVLARLEADGLVEPGPEGPRTTRRWQAAMARAALGMYRAGAPWDLRLPVVAALIELNPDATDEEISRCVGVLLPLEEAALGAVAAASRAP